jgi:hypothetical protein
MRRITVVSIVLLVVLAPGPAAAQGGVVVVVPPAVLIPPTIIVVGQPIAPPEVPPTVVVTPVLPEVVAPPVAPQVGPLLGVGGDLTELNFVSTDPSEAVAISYYNEDPEVEDYVQICATPCTVRAPNGIYEFMAGAHRTFTVYASGGVQDWLVEDNNLGGIIAGSVLTGVGGIGVLVSGVVAAMPHFYWTDDDAKETYTALGITAGACVLGLVIWLASYGTSEQFRADRGYIDVGGGVGLLPTLFTAQNDAGDREWGLGLGLRF